MNGLLFPVSQGPKRVVEITVFTDHEKGALVLYYMVKHSVFGTSLQNNDLTIIFYPIFVRFTCHDLFFSNALGELKEAPGL